VTSRTDLPRLLVFDQAMKRLGIASLLFLGACHRAAVTPGSDQDMSAPIDLATSDFAPADLANLGDPDAAPFDDTIHGSGTLTTASDTGVTQGPRDFSKSTIAALIPNGAGGFLTSPGTGASDGTFSIPAVPRGPYYLRLGQGYRWTSARTPVVDRVRLGRPDAVTAPASTTLAFNVDNLNKWQTTDSLVLYSAGAGAYFSNNVSLQPVASATSLIATLDWAFLPLVDAAKGDVFWLSQQVSGALADGTPFVSIGRIFTPKSFTIASGATTTMAGSFQTLKPDQKFSTLWKRSLFHAQLPAMSPYLLSCQDYVNISAEPYFDQLGSYSSLIADLVTLTVPVGDSDVTVTDLPYTNPYPISWGQFATASVICTSDVTLPGSGQSTPIQVVVKASGPPRRFAGGTIAPTLTPVRKLTINGKDATQALASVGMTPTVAWDAAATGTPTLSQVVVVQVNAMQHGKLAPLTLAGLDSDDLGTRSFTLPTGLLTAGGIYEVIVVQGDGTTTVETHSAIFTP
jgi:hypothetical protein